MRRLSIPLFVAAGIACGLVAVAFHELVELMRKLLIGAALRQHGATHVTLVVVVPALVFAVIAVVIRRFAAPAGGANLARVRHAYGEDIALLDDRSIAATLVLTPISLGAGAPLGPEGPTVVVASGISMWIARLARLPKKLVRSMIPVGTAAGIAAIFNTPITGVVFALEEVMGNASRGLLGGTIVAAVSAAVVERLLLGGKPLLSAPTGTWGNLRELLGFAAAGVAAGAVSGAAVHAVSFLRRLLARIRPLLRAALGGVAIGVIGLFVPVIFSVGYDTTSLFLHGQVQSAATAFIAKVVAFVIALGCGILGGVFAPSLFIGAALGATIGRIAHAADPGAYALVGMGAFFAGLLRCPISAVLIVVEVTGDYGLILPLMLAVALSTSISRAIARENLTERQMRDEGYREPTADDPLAGLTVAEVMTKEVVALPAELTLLDAARRVAGTRHRYYPIVNEERKLIGLLPSEAIESAARENALEQPLAARVQPWRLVARTTDDMRDLIRRMAKEGIDRCPVVDEQERIAGFVSPGDVLRARMTALDDLSSRA
ncbi:MAG TPA: chloride channel protein [Thermoanaerobaculia bacterium]|nr:chloride channel protein [Thermoanaerobaculia bacterium]